MIINKFIKNASQVKIIPIIMFIFLFHSADASIVKLGDGYIKEARDNVRVFLVVPPRIDGYLDPNLISEFKCIVNEEMRWELGEGYTLVMIMKMKEEAPVPLLITKKNFETPNAKQECENAKQVFMAMKTKTMATHSFLSLNINSKDPRNVITIPQTVFTESDNVNFGQGYLPKQMGL